MATGKGVVPTGGPLDKLYESMRGLMKDPAMGVDKPEAVVRMMALDAIKQFVRLTGRPARTVHVPRAVEAALQVDRGRNLGLHEKEHGQLRTVEQLFGLRPVWDAEEFRVE